MERSRKIASQGMVLLENNGILPLKERGKIALFGNGGRNTVKDLTPLE
jgi:beta-glucosidase